MSRSRKNGRNTDGTFGQGNPGRPKGARNRATVAVEELLEGEAESLTRKAIDLALKGDVGALRLCLERISPPRRGHPIQLELPPVQLATDVVAAIAAVIAAVASGELTPDEGQLMAGLLEGQRRIIETGEFEERISKIEQGLKEQE